MRVSICERLRPSLAALSASFSRVLLGMRAITGTKVFVSLIGPVLWGAYNPVLQSATHRYGKVNMSPYSENVNQFFPKSESTFVERLRWLAADRSMSGLMKASGWAGGTIDRVLNEEGFIPGTEMLSAMARVENASMDWLANGFAPPFRVARFRDGNSALDHLTALFDENDWRLNLYTSDHVPPVVVLSKPGTVERRGKALRYTIIEVVTGPWELGQIATLADQANIAVWRAYVDSGSLARLADGYTAGTYGLVEAKEPPFAQIMALPIGVADIESSSYAPAGLSSDEYGLVERYRQLSEYQRALALRLIDALPDPPADDGPQKRRPSTRVHGSGKLGF